MCVAESCAHCRQVFALSRVESPNLARVSACRRPFLPPVGASVTNEGTGSESLLAAGSMDGSVTLLAAASGEVLATERPHNKYVQRVRWSPSGTLLATASSDHSMALLRLSASGRGALTSDSGQGCAGCEAVTTSGTCWSLTIVRQVPFAAPVQDVVFSADGGMCFVAVRDTNFLHRVDGDSGQVRSGWSRWCFQQIGVAWRATVSGYT